MFPLALPLIGAGIGAAAGLLGRNKDRTVTSTQGFDPLTEQLRKDVNSATYAGADSVQGLDPYTQQALGMYGGFANAGQAGMNAFSGGDASRFMNPYQSQVIDQMRGQFGLLNDMAQNSVKSQFTRAGAFGGSRQGVAAGQAAADVANNIGNQIAGFQHQGFNDAMGRAFQSANLGLGASQQMAALGPYAQMMNDPNLRRAYMLKQGMQGMPIGTTSTGPNPNYQSPGQALLGGAMSGFGLLGGFRGGSNMMGANIPTPSVGMMSSGPMAPGPIAPGQMPYFRGF